MGRREKEAALIPLTRLLQVKARCADGVLPRRSPKPQTPEPLNQEAAVFAPDPSLCCSLETEQPQVARGVRM